MTNFLTLEDLIDLVDDLQVGPVRDFGLLDSAASRPQTVLFGREVYPTIDEKAAVMLESILKNHALVDGNEHLGWLAIAVFYDISGLGLFMSDDEAYDMVIALASSNISHEEVAKKLQSWQKSSM